MAAAPAGVEVKTGTTAADEKCGVMDHLTALRLPTGAVPGRAAPRAVYSVTPAGGDSSSSLIASFVVQLAAYEETGAGRSDLEISKRLPVRSMSW